MNWLSQRLLLVLASGAMVLSATAQKKGNPNRACPSGTEEVAFFEETADIRSGGPIDGVEILSVQNNDEGEVIGGEWTSAHSIVALVVKGGGGAGGASPAEYVFFEPSKSGTFTNAVLPKDQEISNLRFCGSSTACEFSDFTERVNREDNRIEISVQDANGISSLRFTNEEGAPLLDNLEVELVRAVDGGGTPTDFRRDEPDSDVKWTAGSGPLPSEIVMHLNQINTSDPEVGYFLRSNNGCGTLTYIDPERTLVRLPEKRFRTDGNHPNPFRDQTSIRFMLPSRSTVSVAVYDLMGRRVATLVDRSLSAGLHEVYWNGRSDSGRSLASGVYLYRIQSGSVSESGRMTLIR